MTFAASATNVYFVKRAVATVVVVAAVRNVASDTEIDVFHSEYLRIAILSRPAANYARKVRRTRKNNKRVDVMRGY